MELVLRAAVSSSLLLSSLAVRRQAWGVAPYLPPPTQVQPYSSMAVVTAPQSVHPYLREVRASPLDEGASAYFDSIRKDLDESMKRDFKDLRLGFGTDFNDLEARMRKDFDKDFERLRAGRGADFKDIEELMRKDFDLDLLKEPPSDFLFDFFDNVMKLPDLPKMDPPAKGDSITRKLQITEEDGQREEKEEVTRCHDGKCTTEVVRGNDGKASKDRSGEAAPKQRMSFESISRASRSGDTDWQQQQQQKEVQRRWRLPGFGKKSKTSQDQGASAGAKSEDDRVEDSRMYSESVMRTMISRDVDGRREEVETIERCQNGECTKEERRLGGAADAEKKGSGAVRPAGRREPVALQGGIA